jgi:hypothetical protein
MSRQAQNPAKYLLSDKFQYYTDLPKASAVLEELPRTNRYALQGENTDI